MATTKRGTGRSTRAFGWIAAVAVLLAALLTGAWFYAANRLDGAVREAIAAAAGGGARLGCENQSVFGYPFRIGLSCAAVAIEVPAKSVSASAGALRTAAQIYEPSRIVAELDGPLRVDTPHAPPLDIRWNRLQASTHFWTQGVDRLAIVAEEPDVALAGPAGERSPFLRSAHLEVHARRNGGNLDFALENQGVKPMQAGLEALPAFDLSLDLTVAGAADWLSGERPGDTLGQALRGRSGTLRALSLGLAAPASGRAELSGPFDVDENGEVSGRFQVALADPGAIADLVAELVPGAAGIAGTLASGIGLVGRQENGRTVLDVEVRRGRASLGFIPLGRIPPIE